jgi:CBS domain containing-hemolysin-like protein
VTAALIVAAVCLVVEAFFSGSEIAVVACDRIKVRQGVEEGRRSARLLSQFLQVPQRLLATTLVGTQMAIVTSTVTVTLALTSREGNLGELYTLAALTPVLVILGEIVPKSLAQQHADRLAPRIIWPLWIASVVLAPLTFAMSRFASWAAWRLGLEGRHKSVTREDLELIMKAGPGAGPGAGGRSEISEGERRMIARIFDFGDRTARDVMVPLSSVAAVDEASSLEEVVREFEDKGFTRLPVYRERLDRMVGMVHAFDVLKAGRRETTLAEMMRPPIYAPESQPAIDLLVELQRRRQGMAVVVDEYGGAVGVVTIEDILEEVVGEIEDEYDVRPPAIRREGDGLWRVRARTTIREVNQELKLELPEGEDYETIGGLLLDRLKHIPRVGELVREGTVTLRVMEASERAIEEVQIRLVRRR